MLLHASSAISTTAATTTAAAVTTTAAYATTTTAAAAATTTASTAKFGMRGISLGLPMFCVEILMYNVSPTHSSLYV